MSQERTRIRVLVPEGILGNDLKTNKKTTLPHGRITASEAFIRNKEVLDVIKALIQHGDLTLAQVQTALISYESSQQVRGGLVVNIDGEEFWFEAELKVGNRN